MDARQHCEKRVPFRSKFPNSSLGVEGFLARFLLRKTCSAAASGWAGWVLALPEFGSSVNPITTRGGGADYAHHITASPPGFEIPAAALLSNFALEHC